MKRIDELKLLEPGEAICVSGTSIQISEPDDWAWYFIKQKREANDARADNAEEVNVILLLQVRKTQENTVNDGKKWLKFKNGWELSVIDKSDDIGDVSDLGIEEITNENGYPKDIILSGGELNIKSGMVVHGCFIRVSKKHYFTIKKKNGDIKKMASILDGSGYYPSFFIFMLGETSSGKTCWLHCLKTARGFGRLQTLYDQEKRTIHAFGFKKEKTGVLKPTALDKIRVQSYVLKVHENSRFRTKCVALIVDLGGEVNNLRNKETSLREIRTSIAKYASGIFVVRNEKWLLSIKQEDQTIINKEEDDLNDQEIGTSDPTEFIVTNLNDANNEDSLSRDKFCYILTGIDRIKKAFDDDNQYENLSQALAEENINLAPDSPIFCDINNNKDKMYENMAVASNIMRTRDRYIQKDSPCFAVCCCTDAKDEQGNKALNFGKGYNAELPLVYMLKRLVKI